jgi:hypothetical protein
MCQNAEHSMATALIEVLTTIEAFTMFVAAGEVDRIPQLEWSIEGMYEGGDGQQVLRELPTVSPQEMVRMGNNNNNNDNKYNDNGNNDGHVMALVNDTTGDITVTIDTRRYAASKLLRVQMWHASSQIGARDFRWVAGFPKPHLQLHFWKKTVLTARPQADGQTTSSPLSTYVAHMPVPDQSKGAVWTAFFVEAIFDGLKGQEGTTIFQTTSQVSIIPQSFPFPNCHGEQCKGRLL